MKAIIRELWNTGIDIITTGNEENMETGRYDGFIYEIKSLSDLRKCDNVLVGEKDPEGPCTEIMLGDSIFMVSFRQVTHPTHLGKLRVCEIY